MSRNHKETSVAAQESAPTHPGSHSKQSDACLEGCLEASGNAGRAGIAGTSGSAESAGSSGSEGIADGRARPTRALLVLAFVALYVFWGSTYLGSKFAMVSFPPYLLGGIRFVVAGVLLGGWLLATRRAPLGAFANARWWSHATVAGVLFFAVANGLVSMGVQRVPSGLAALVVGLTSVWIVLFDRLLSRAGAPPRTIAAGLAMGVAGVAVLGGPSWTGPEGELDSTGLVMVAASTLAWAAATVFTTRAARPPSLLAASAMQMIAGGVAMFAASACFERATWPAPDEIAWSAVAAIGYLVVFGSLVGFTAYVFLLEHVSATAVATYAYVNPLVALLLGAALASERVPLRTWIAAPLILGAVALMQAVRPPARNQPPVDEE